MRQAARGPADRSVWLTLIHDTRRNRADLEYKKNRSTRAEIRDGSTRPVNREYYYIPLHPVVDAIKYKVSKLTSTIKAQYTPSEERKEYICLRCGSEWTELDVLSLVSDEGFECQNCGAVLERTEDVKGVEGTDRTGHEKNSKLMAQLDNMLKLLKQIDSVEIPPNDFDTAWDHKVEVVRDQRIHPTRAAIPVPPRQQDALRSNVKTDAAGLEISLTSSEEKSAADQAEEAARKAAVEKQNALPVWHTHSTISASAAGNIGNLKPETSIGVKSELADEDQKPTLDALDDKVAAYYAEMAREKALQAQEDASSEEEDSDEFGDEFEDVGGISGPSGPGTPGGPASASFTSAPSVTGIKREHDTASSVSAGQSSVDTPSTPADDGPEAKKIKVESNGKTELDIKPGPDVKAEIEIKKEEEESDEDDEEFEDV